jgi:integrase
VTVAAGTELTPAQAARILRDAIKDKGYRAFPLGLEFAQYLRYAKTQRDFKPSSVRDYEICGSRLSKYFADLELKDFEPPVGAERLEEFLYHYWEGAAPRTFSKNLSILVSFFDWAVKRGRLYGNPARVLDRPKARKKVTPTFQTSFRDQVLGAQTYIPDQLGCELILTYGLRRSEVARAQVKDFLPDILHLHVFGKGAKERLVPILDPRFFMRLEQWQLEEGAGPDSYLLYRRDARKRIVPLDQATEILDVPKTGRVGYAWVESRFHDREINGNSVHRWWYRCLERAGVVEPGTTRGANMHRGRHTAITEFLRSPHGDLKLAQLMAGHSSEATTADIYDHRDTTDLAKAMAAYLGIHLDED